MQKWEGPGMMEGRLDLGTRGDATGVHVPSPVMEDPDERRVVLGPQSLPNFPAHVASIRGFLGRESLELEPARSV